MKNRKGACGGTCLSSTQSSLQPRWELRRAIRPQGSSGSTAPAELPKGADGSLVAPADFKSVAVSRKRRWVGSIPTRSRQFPVEFVGNDIFLFHHSLSESLGLRGMPLGLKKEVAAVGHDTVLKCDWPTIKEFAATRCCRQSITEGIGRGWSIGI